MSNRGPRSRPRRDASRATFADCHTEVSSGVPNERGCQRSFHGDRGAGNDEALVGEDAMAAWSNAAVRAAAPCPAHPPTVRGDRRPSLR